MDPVIFLLGLTFIWIVFATIQDLRTREIADWLTFSLIGFGLGFRLFQSYFTGDFSILSLSILGFLLLSSISYLFYYAGAFAGGDAKLLIGLGAVLANGSITALLLSAFVLVASIFVCGAIWSFAYTGFKVVPQWHSFSLSFHKELLLRTKLIGAFALISLVFIFIFASFNLLFALLVGFFIFLCSFLLVYARVFERELLVNQVSPAHLTVGDWLARPVKLKGKTIPLSVHGLSMNEILLLRRLKKKVFIKNGIPFAPAFFFGFLVFLAYYFRIIYLGF